MKFPPAKCNITISIPNILFCTRGCYRFSSIAAYNGLAKPILDYTTRTWDPHTDNLISLGKGPVSGSFRFVTSNYSSRHEPREMTEILNYFNWPYLQARRQAVRKLVSEPELIAPNKGPHNMANVPLENTTEPSG